MVYVSPLERESSVLYLKHVLESKNFIAPCSLLDQEKDNPSFFKNLTGLLSARDRQQLVINFQDALKIKQLSEESTKP